MDIRHQISFIHIWLLWNLICISKRGTPEFKRYPRHSKTDKNENFLSCKRGLLMAIVKNGKDIKIACKNNARAITYHHISYLHFYNIIYKYILKSIFIAMLQIMQPPGTFFPACVQDAKERLNGRT